MWNPRVIVLGVGAAGLGFGYYYDSTKSCPPEGKRKNRQDENDDYRRPKKGEAAQESEYKLRKDLEKERGTFSGYPGSSSRTAKREPKGQDRRGRDDACGEETQTRGGKRNPKTQERRRDDTCEEDTQACSTSSGGIKTKGEPKGSERTGRDDTCVEDTQTCSSRSGGIKTKVEPKAPERSGRDDTCREDTQTCSSSKSGGIKTKREPKSPERSGREEPCGDASQSGQEECDLRENSCAFRGDCHYHERTRKVEAAVEERSGRRRHTKGPCDG